MNEKYKISNRVKRFLEDGTLDSLEYRDVRILTTDILIIRMINTEGTELRKYFVSNYSEFEDNYLEEDIIYAKTIESEFVKNAYLANEKKEIYSDEIQSVLNKAYEIALEKGLEEIDEMSLTVALVQFRSSYWNFLKSAYEVDIIELKKYFSISRYLNDEIKEIDLSKRLNAGVWNNYELFKAPEKNNSMFELLNGKVNKKGRNVICGRDKEIKKVFNLFQKMTVRGIILKGPAGVGKTAIVEGLVERIVKKQCPEEFIGKEVYSLDFEGLLENTKYVGQFEEKVKKLKDFLQSHDNVILFIDEIHNIIGAGRSANSSYDLANGLKPILTDGKVRIIGATTDEEYKRYFKFDSALRRRFQVIDVKQPGIKNLKKMLIGKVNQLEEFHKVKVPDKSFDFAVMEASKYNYNISNPARTVDILDNAMVIAKNKKKEELEINDILEVHDENINLFRKIPKNIIKQVAYHEAGHYIVHRVLRRRNGNTELVSIIPADDYLGVNILDLRDRNYINTRQDMINEIAELLAGEKAMVLKGYNENSGKANDLEEASKIARKMILEFGMLSTKSDLLGEYSSYSEGGRINIEYLSNKQKEELTKQVNIILQEGYNLAEKTLKKKFEKLELIANALQIAGSLEKEQLNSLYTGKITLEDIPRLQDKK